MPDARQRIQFDWIESRMKCSKWHGMIYQKKRERSSFLGVRWAAWAENRDWESRNGQTGITDVFLFFYAH